MPGIGIGLGLALTGSSYAERTPEAPVNVSPPTILGTARVGEILTATVGTWTGYPAPQFTFQWNRDGSPIVGAQAATYELGAADYGAVITVTVTATNSEGSASETSEATAEVAGIAPANTVAPSISGTAQVGETLTASAGTWTGYPAPSYSYQWKRDGNSIIGATNSTYQLVAADYGAVITVTVTATNSEGASSETSAGTSAVAGLAPVNTAAPVISGTPKVGESLSVTTGTWTGVPAPSISYQWTRDGSDIPGATGSTYTLIEDDEDAMIGCRVTATNAEGSDSADAEEVGPVEAGEIEFVGSAAIDDDEVTLPSHQAGDLIVVLAFIDAESGTAPALPDGFTNVANGNGAPVPYRIGYKFAASSSEASGTWAGADYTAAFVWRGVSAVGATAADREDNSTFVRYPGLTLDAEESVVAAISTVYFPNFPLEEPPAGMVNRATHNPVSVEICVFDTDGVVSSWSQDTVQIGADNNTGWTAITLELTP